MPINKQEGKKASGVNYTRLGKQRNLKTISGWWFRGILEMVGIRAQYQNRRTPTRMEMCCEMLSCGGSESIIIDDFEWVVGEGRLELREEQVQWARKQWVDEEKHVLAAMALMEEVISDHCQLKLKGNQDVWSITDAIVLKINETGKSDRFIGWFSEFRKRRSKLNWEWSKKL